MGARQVGKSTLARQLISEGWSARYITLDDELTLENREGFVDPEFHKIVKGEAVIENDAGTRLKIRYRKEKSSVTLDLPNNVQVPGRILSGADWVFVRNDGVIFLDTRVTMQFEVPGAGNKGMLKTGLEGLLAEFNVRVGDKFVYVFPTQQHPIPDIASAAFNQASGMGRHPITTALVRSVSSFPMAFPREIAPSQTSQSYQSSILLGSLNTTWLEDNRVNRGELETVLRQLVQNESVQIAKSLSERGRPLAVVVTESGSGLLAVFGCTEFASDEEAKSLPPDTATRIRSDGWNMS
jgi:hypothetical protein